MPLNAFITMRVTQASAYPEPRDSISHEWIILLENWGLNPVLVPNVSVDPCRYLGSGEKSILILTGGEDPGTNPERDRTELALLKTAIDRSLPILGVCRGMQLINTFLGGGVIDIENHVARPHDVSFSHPLDFFYGGRAQVNSFHARGISQEAMASGVICAAKDDEGLIEAFCHKNYPLVAVMWHPERGSPLAGDRNLAMRLIEEGAFWA